MKLSWETSNTDIFVGFCEYRVAFRYQASNIQYRDKPLSYKEFYETFNAARNLMRYQRAMKFTWIH